MLLIILLWIGSVSCDTIGQTAFKLAALSPQEHKGVTYWKRLFSHYWLWIGFASYGVGFLFWVAFLTLLPLSQAILLGSFNIITVMIVGRILFKEHFTLLRTLGIALISCGVVLVGIG